MLQIILQIDPDVLVHAQKAELSTQKKLMLTKKGIREHPEVQKRMIPKLAALKPKQAEIAINQKIRDIEDGYIVKEGSGAYVYSGKDARDREIIKSNTDKIIDLPPAIELDIVSHCNRFIFLLTGRTLTRGETEYTKEIIDKNNERRYKIVKSCNGDMRELNNLFEPLVLAKRAITDMLEILNAEMDVANKKREMMNK